jgi:alkanesulfonate monooxygenase
VDLRIFTEPQQGALYDDLLRVARCTEDAGFDGFFRSDHYLAIGEGSGEPGPTDAWATLAALARETSRVRLGTLLTPVTFRLPGPLAIMVAQADQMSGGRIELGFGAGWFEAEHTAYGIPFPPARERFELLTEQLAVVTGLWRTLPGDRFDFDGEHYQLRDCPALPKPAQQPHPPVILGGTGPRRGPALAAQYAAEYNVAFHPIDVAARQFERVDRACTEIGRDPETMVRSLALTVAVGRDDAEVSRRALAIGRDVEELQVSGLAGTPAEVLDRIGHWRDQTRATRLYLQVLDLADLDHIELIAAELAPQLH